MERQQAMAAGARIAGRPIDVAYAARFLEAYETTIIPRAEIEVARGIIATRLRPERTTQPNRYADRERRRATTQ